VALCDLHDAKGRKRKNAQNAERVQKGADWSDFASHRRGLRMPVPFTSIK
jgi:hypothetical protein